MTSEPPRVCLLPVTPPYTLLTLLSGHPVTPVDSFVYEEEKKPLLQSLYHLMSTTDPIFLGDFHTGKLGVSPV